MKWNSPQSGDIKTFKRFLLVPKEINGEYRWLTFAKYECIYSVFYMGHFTTLKWRPVRWVD
jgi:hypothetical protein